MNVRWETVEQLAWAQFWQLTLVFLVVGMLARYVSATRPHLAYVLWMIVLVKALTPPLWSSPTSAFSWIQRQDGSSESVPTETSTIVAQGPQTSAATIAVETSAEFPAGTVDSSNPNEQPAENQSSGISVSAALLLVWLCGSMAIGGLLLGRWSYYAVLLRHHCMPTAEEASQLFNTLAQRLSLRQNVQLLSTDRPFGPAVYGAWQPALILPEALIRESSPAHLERVMAHELIHLRRGDHVIGFLQVIMQIVWWFQPLAWWANRQICQQRERCCDEEVISNLRCDPAAYAQSLLDVLKLRKQLRPALLPVLDATEVTEKRLEGIMDQHKQFQRRTPRIYWLAFVLGSLFVVPGAGFRSPTASADPLTGKPERHAAATPANLQEVINTAKPGGVITVEPGVYKDPLTIEKPVTLQGAGTAKCVLEVTADRPALTIASKGRVVVEGLTIKWQLASSKQTQAPPCAVLVTDSKATLKNCHVLAAGNPKRSPAALQSGGFSTVNLENCRFEGFEFCINYTGGAEGKISDCVVLKPGHCGITVYSGSKIEVVRTIVAGSKYHGIRSTGGTLAVHDSLIAHNDNRGIYLGNKPARGYVRNNVLLGNASGISGFGGSQVAITNNLLLDSSYVGVDTRDSCQLTIKNNIFQNNPKGLAVYAEGGRSRVRLHKNTFWKNKTDVESIEKVAGSYGLEPAFRAPEKGDFALQTEELTTAKQGLTDPAAFVELWKKWEGIAAAL